MYSENPLLLEMSTRQLLKKKKLYTPEQWRSMMDRLQKIGKNANAPISGLHSADEYGMRMYNGQIKRAFKTAKKHNRKLTLNTNYSEPNNASTLIDFYDGDIISISPNQTAQPSLKYIATHQPRKILRSHLKDTRNMSNNLSLGNVLAHEVDEYSTGLNRARKYGLTPGKVNISGLALRGGQARTSSHHPGVLDREAKRYKMLSSLYGRDKFNLYKRDHEQFAKNKPKFVDKNIEIKRRIFSSSHDSNVRNKLIPPLQKDKLMLADDLSKRVYKRLGFDLQSKIKNPRDVSRYSKALDNKIDKLKLEMDKLLPTIENSESLTKFEGLENMINKTTSLRNNILTYGDYKFGDVSSVYKKWSDIF